MRAWSFRAFNLVALAIAAVAGDPVQAVAQTAAPRPVPLAVESVVPTRIESLLTAPNVVLVTDYYRIDTRYGPNIRIDAVIVEALDSRARFKGLRVQVRDPDNRNRQEGTSYIDHDELTRLTRGLPAMAERAAKWMNDDRQASELTFTTAGGFRIAIRQSVIRVPRAYLSTGLFDPVVTSIELTEIPALMQAFEQALALLNSK